VKFELVGWLSRSRYYTVNNVTDEVISKKNEFEFPTKTILAIKSQTDTCTVKFYLCFDLSRLSEWKKLQGFTFSSQRHEK